MSRSGAIKLNTGGDLADQHKPVTPAAPPATAQLEADTPGGRSPARTLDEFFLPDFCAARMVLGVVLISELLALMFTLARPNQIGFLQELARVSLFLQWLGLTGATLLCYSRRWLSAMSVPVACVCAFALMLANTAMFCEIAFWLGSRLSDVGLSANLFPSTRWDFLLRNLGICAIVTAMLLRYFFVAHQWRLQLRAEARSRIHALQARIRPHFLFNSMNTIASLTRTSPKLAEEAVEDLADLFRATLKDSDSPLRLKAELELSRMYQRIEALRLGPRLQVKWDVASLPMRAFIPSLTIQPLLENAIYHGIEPLDDGGTVEVRGHVDGSDLVISVANPVASDGRKGAREGNRIALENIRQRLRLAYGARGCVDVQETADRYEVTLRFPYEE
jgi:two-component system sensor histidine kinase AlgZ